MGGEDERWNHQIWRRRRRAPTLYKTSRGIPAQEIVPETAPGIAPETVSETAPAAEIVPEHTEDRTPTCPAGRRGADTQKVFTIAIRRKTEKYTRYKNITIHLGIQKGQIGPFSEPCIWTAWG